MLLTQMSYSLVDLETAALVSFLVLTLLVMVVFFETVFGGLGLEGAGLGLGLGTLVMTTRLMSCVEADVWAQHDAAAAEAEESESGGVSGTTIFIVLLVVIVLVAAGVTGFAYQKKILCFEKSSEGEETGGEETQPLNKATSASQLSPSRATSASGTTLTKSRPSGTTVYGIQ